MDINNLKKILGLFDKSTATELIIEEEGMKISISRQNKSEDPPAQPQYMAMPQYMQPPAPAQQPQEANPQPAEPEPAPVKTEEPKESSGLHEIRSPIVGTFYRSPSPDSDPFVEVGSHIAKGQTLCIVEAMKLMNEIESDINGTIEKIILNNAEPVEFDQPMFLIKPD
jgi:acetyl-CoA carboxylase biotin carboxyl carrier protein